MSDKLDDYIRKVECLPATPAVLVKLIMLFRQPDRDVDEIVASMTGDPALTAEVLRHCNSAYFRREQPIVDLFEATMQLGFHEVYRLAVAMFGLQALSVPQDKCSINVKKLWRHSTTVAAAAAVIARKVDGPEGLAFTAGLLHDVGKIVMASAEGADYAALTEELGGKGFLMHEAEVSRFGFGHSEVGAHLLARWGLPEEIYMPVRHHHDVDWAQPFEQLCAIVSLGNGMAHLAEASLPEKPYDSQETVCAMGVLKLGEDDMNLLLTEAQKEIERLEGLLN